MSEPLPLELLDEPETPPEVPPELDKPPDPPQDSVSLDKVRANFVQLYLQAVESQAEVKRTEAAIKQEEQTLGQLRQMLQHRTRQGDLINAKINAIGDLFIPPDLPFEEAMKTNFQGVRDILETIRAAQVSENASQLGMVDV